MAKKRTLKLNSANLHKIIKEAIESVLGKNRDIDINSIDISKIDINVLKQSYVDLRLTPTLTVYGDPLSSIPTVNEAVGEIMSPDNVVRQIIQKYGLNQQLVVKKEAYNKIYVYVIVACIGHNDELIESDMKKLGYFLGARGNVQNIQGMRFQVLQFEPYSQMQNNETTNIKKRYNYLFHWTPEYNLNGIMQNGLIPSKKNNLFNYPPRIYLMKEDGDQHEILNLGQQLCLVNSNQDNNGIYVLLRINLNTIDNNIQFYYDPNSVIGIYTEQSIPPSNIAVIGKFNFKNK